MLRRAVADTPAFGLLSPPRETAPAEEILTALRWFPLLTKAELRRNLPAFVELVRADGRLITEPGEQGEITGTGLFPRATTMIRYRTGDLGAWAGPAVLERIDGRRASS